MSRSPRPVRRRSGLGLAGLLLLGSMLTGARREKGVEVPAVIEQAEQAAATDRAAAIASLERYISGAPEPDVLPWAKVWAGEQRRLAGDLAVARGWFESAALDHPTHPLKDAAVLGMALVDAHATLSGNTLATIQLKDTPSAPATMRADRLRILARASVSDGTVTRKVREMAAQAVELAEDDPEVAERLRMVLADLLVESGRPTPPPTLDPSGKPLPPQVAALESVRASLRDGSHEEAARRATSLIGSWPDTPEAAQAKWLQKRAEAKDPTVGGRVGVLLPLTGELAQPAARIKDSITLANTVSGKGMELVFIDTEGKAEKAAAAVEELVLVKGCVAILGPLHKDEVAAVGPIAQGLGVPLISFTQSGDPTEGGEYLFGGFLSMEAQIEALVEHAMEGRGLRRFGVLHPRTSYGDTARDLFIAAVTRRGGTVPHVVPYAPDDKDLRGEARLLGQKTGPRPEKGTPDRPTIDFDALFLPDSFRRATLVASALAYEEFPVGTFRPAFGGQGLPLLGLNGWNNPSVVEEGAEYMRGAIFVDAFHPDQGGTGTTAFVSSYEGTYSREPTLLDAVVYDTARVVSAAVQAGGSSREEIRSQLGKVRLTDSATGAIGFGEDREIERKMLVLTIGRSSIELWSPETGP